VQIAPVVQPLHFLKFLLGVREEVDAQGPHGVGEQDFGGEPRDGDSGAFQEFGSLEKRGAHRHRCFLVPTCGSSRMAGQTLADARGSDSEDTRQPTFRLRRPAV
jgi:hypothetical protein